MIPYLFDPMWRMAGSPALAEGDVKTAFACDQELLDLRTAIADGANPIIPVVARHRAFIHVAKSAVNLDGEIGAFGYMDECPVSRYYRDNRVCTIGDGSSQIQKLLIARECGLDVTFS